MTACAHGGDRFNMGSIEALTTIVLGFTTLFGLQYFTVRSNVRTIAKIRQPINEVRLWPPALRDKPVD